MVVYVVSYSIPFLNARRCFSTVFKNRKDAEIFCKDLERTGHEREPSILHVEECEVLEYLEGN